MSTDPTGLKNESSSEALKKQYINIDFTVSDWCSYDGECAYTDLLSNHKCICLLCKYRVLLDIPQILNYKKSKRLEDLERKGVERWK